MKSVSTMPTNQLIIDMEPKDIFRRLAQLQPHHKWIWKKSFAHWKKKNAL